MNKQTEHTRTVYNRRAPSFARMEKWERYFTGRWRQKQWQQVQEAANILEVGVGTGINFAYYPPKAQVQAVDLGEVMIKYAKEKAEALQLKNVKLQVMDVQALELPDNFFDAAIASFVFCSVPDPVLGLAEIKRVLKPGAKAVFLEHVRSENRLIGWLMDKVDPLTHKYGGMHINRRTVANIQKAEFQIEKIEDVALQGIVKLIVAKKAN